MSANDSIAVQVEEAESRVQEARRVWEALLAEAQTLVATITTAADKGEIKSIRQAQQRRDELVLETIGAEIRFRTLLVDLKRLQSREGFAKAGELRLVLDEKDRLIRDATKERQALGNEALGYSDDARYKSKEIGDENRKIDALRNQLREKAIAR